MPLKRDKCYQENFISIVVSEMFLFKKTIYMYMNLKNDMMNKQDIFTPWRSLSVKHMSAKLL